jgi:hypothetical protein
VITLNSSGGVFFQATSESLSSDRPDGRRRPVRYRYVPCRRAGSELVRAPVLPRVEVLAVIERTKDLDRRSVILFRNALEWEPCSRAYSGIMLDRYLESFTLRAKY